MKHHYRRCRQWQITRWQRFIWRTWTLYAPPGLMPTWRRRHPPCRWK